MSSDRPKRLYFANDTLSVVGVTLSIILDQVLLLDAPFRILIGLEVLETLLLFLFGNVQEEFDHEISVVAELSLGDINGAYLFLVLIPV